MRGRGRQLRQIHMYMCFILWLGFWPLPSFVVDWQDACFSKSKWFQVSSENIFSPKHIQYGRIPLRIPRFKVPLHFHKISLDKSDICAAEFMNNWTGKLFGMCSSLSQFRDIFEYMWPNFDNWVVWRREFLENPRWLIHIHCLASSCRCYPILHCFQWSKRWRSVMRTRSAVKKSWKRRAITTFRFARLTTGWKCRRNYAAKIARFWREKSAESNSTASSMSWTNVSLFEAFLSVFSSETISQPWHGADWHLWLATLLDCQAHLFGFLRITWTFHFFDVFLLLQRRLSLLFLIKKRREEKAGIINHAEGNWCCVVSPTQPHFLVIVNVIWEGIVQY